MMANQIWMMPGDDLDDNYDNEDDGQGDKDG